ncbi:MAG: fibronectin type III domain-containing protein [Desulfobacterales bacterium]|nr:fibronectin type III domain-containing protein [Desulfobacterales bacterium]
MNSLKSFRVHGVGRFFAIGLVLFSLCAVSSSAFALGGAPAEPPPSQERPFLPVPQNARVSEITSTHFSIFWDLCGDHALYRIHVERVDPAPSQPRNYDIRVSEGSARVSGLAAGEGYRAWVQYLEEDGRSSGRSNVVRFRARPTAPSNVRLTAATRNTLSLAWNPGSAYGTGRFVYSLRLEPLSSGGRVREFPVYGESCRVDGLEANTQYRITIKTAGRESVVSREGNGNLSPSTEPLTVRTLRPVTASLENSSYTVSEGGTSVMVGVELSDSLDRASRLWLTQTLESAGARDIAYLKTPVHIPAGALSVEVPIFIIDDLLDEGDETFSLSLSVDPLSQDDVDISGTQTSQVTITDNDTLRVSISSNEMEAITEGEEASFTLSALNVSGTYFPTFSVPVTITHVDGSTEERLIEVTPAQRAGDSVSKTFSVYALADNTNNSGTLTVAPGPVSGFTAGSSASVSVLPTTLAVVRFAERQTSHLLREGGEGTTDSLVVVGGDGSEVSVSVVPEASTASTDDYATDTISVTLTTASSFNLPTITDDRIAEKQERFYLRLELPSESQGEVVLGTPARREVRIDDNEVFELSLAAEASSYLEAGSPNDGEILTAVVSDPALATNVGILLSESHNDSKRNLRLLGPLWVFPETPDENGLYRASATTRGYNAVTNLSDTANRLTVGIMPSPSFTVSGSPVTMDIRQADICEMGLERPFYQVERGVASVRVAVLFTRRPPRDILLTLRLQKKEGSLPENEISEIFDDSYSPGVVTRFTFGPLSPLRMEVDVPLAEIRGDDWDDIIRIKLEKAPGWGRIAWPYAFSKLIVEE